MIFRPKTAETIHFKKIIDILSIIRCVYALDLSIEFKQFKPIQCLIFDLFLKRKNDRLKIKSKVEIIVEKNSN